MRIEVLQHHIDNGLRCATAHPLALAIKDVLDNEPVPQGYLRVERVVSVCSSVGVTEHRIIKRKGREEVDLFFKKYWLGQPLVLPNGDETYNLYDPAIDWSTDYGFGEPVGPTTIEIVEAREEKRK